MCENINQFYLHRTPILVALVVAMRNVEGSCHQEKGVKRTFKICGLVPDRYSAIVSPSLRISPRALFSPILNHEKGFEEKEKKMLVEKNKKKKIVIPIDKRLTYY